MIQRNITQLTEITTTQQLQSARHSFYKMFIRNSPFYEQCYFILWTICSTQ